MQRVLFISKGSDSASTRYRALDFFPLLQQAGWQCTHITSTRSVFNYIKVLRAAARADVVVVLRKTFSHWFISQLRKRARRLVFDFDDAIFARSNGKRSVKRAKGFKRIVQHADAVWAGNRFLAEKAGEFNSHVHLVPTSIDMSRYSMNVEKSAEHIDIVWIGSSSTRKYLHMALPALTQACAHNNRLRLKIIADFDIYDTGIPTVAIPWSAESEAGELANAHIGIAPLSDNVWTRGKCALKVLQYMAAGLPVISSNAGANAEVVEDGNTGVLVNSHEGWVAAINELASDKGKREDFGAAGRARCEQHYSQRAIFVTILDTLNKLMI
jgi:glycosyltransferase involved in cell wall biosynthesis